MHQFPAKDSRAKQIDATASDHATIERAGEYWLLAYGATSKSPKVQHGHASLSGNCSELRFKISQAPTHNRDRLDVVWYLFDGFSNTYTAGTQ